jgi:hypothetical protein
LIRLQFGPVFFFCHRTMAGLPVPFGAAGGRPGIGGPGLGAPASSVVQVAVTRGNGLHTVEEIESAWITPDGATLVRQDQHIVGPTPHRHHSIWREAVGLRPLPPKVREHLIIETATVARSTVQEVVCQPAPCVTTQCATICTPACPGTPRPF